MSTPPLSRRFGLLQATALNMSNMIGIGPFITIPLLMSALGGPQALLGWLVALIIVIADGLIWSELGASLPGSGGSYRYLREGFARAVGTVRAFLFIWQFILSGPLEIASGYIGFASYLRYIWPDLTDHRHHLVAMAVGLANIALLYRRIGAIGTLTVSLWIGTLVTTLAVIVTGALHFDARRCLRLSARRLRVLPRVPARARRGVARRHLRLSGLLRRLLHRRRGEGSRTGHPAVDPDQRVCRRAHLHRDQPLDHRRHLVARVRPGRRPSRVELHRLGVHGADLRAAGGDVLHRVRSCGRRSGRCSRCCSATRASPTRRPSTANFFKAFARLHPTKGFPTVSLLVIGGDRHRLQRVVARHGHQRAAHDPDAGAVHRADHGADRCCAGRGRRCLVRSGCGSTRCRTSLRSSAGSSCSRRPGPRPFSTACSCSGLASWRSLPGRSTRGRGRSRSRNGWAGLLHNRPFRSYIVGSP